MFARRCTDCSKEHTLKGENAVQCCAVDLQASWVGYRSTLRKRGKPGVGILRIHIQTVFLPSVKHDERDVPRIQCATPGAVLTREHRDLGGLFCDARREEGKQRRQRKHGRKTNFEPAPSAFAIARAQHRQHEAEGGRQLEKEIHLPRVSHGAEKPNCRHDTTSAPTVEAGGQAGQGRRLRRRERGRRLEGGSNNEKGG
jgi:hypothetical protein